MDSSRPDQAALPARCPVCGGPIEACSGPGSPVLQACRSETCRSVAAQQARLPAGQFAAYLELQRFRLRERRAGQPPPESRAMRQRRGEERANRRILDELIAGEPALAFRPIHVLGLPTGERPLVPVPRARIVAYRAHLEEILARAEDPDPPRLATADRLRLEMRHAADRRLLGNPALGRISAALCAHCRGGCCVGGGDHAYLDAPQIRRRLAASPGAGAAGLLARYLARVPERSVEGSCIHHGAAGCTLPTELRSDSCSAFFCDPLRDYHKASGDRPPAPVLAVQREYDHWRRHQAGPPARIIGVVLVDPVAAAPRRIG